jgi:hypothetical protein
MACRQNNSHTAGDDEYSTLEPVMCSGKKWRESTVTMIGFPGYEL